MFIDCDHSGQKILGIGYQEAVEDSYNELSFEWQLHVPLTVIMTAISSGMFQRAKTFKLEIWTRSRSYFECFKT